MNSDLKTSERFQAPQKRRDFLGLAALWSAIGTFGVALLGMLRLPMPSAFPESNSRVKLGPLNRFLNTEVTALPEQRLWIHSDDNGLYAISAVCTHLGCIVSTEASGGYFCPCHGSRFNTKGKMVSGPAPRPLDYLELTISPDGQLVVDQLKPVKPEARLEV